MPVNIASFIIRATPIRLYTYRCRVDDAGIEKSVKLSVLDIAAVVNIKPMAGI
ncbi:hypothetical protein [Zhongshania arctica]|uniref:Uncharacterized protein n=1 Tax=Zhongshania arctica TaxID=3238302 RepID=A0ABV3TTA8_9GAMM